MEDWKTVDVELFKQGMRQLVGAVTLITTRDATQRRGMTATAVCSLSAEPPSLLVCINRTAEAHDVILSGRCFCMSLLSYSQQSLAESFAGRDGSKGEERFERGKWGVLATGAPYLEDSLAAFDCALTDTHGLRDPYDLHRPRGGRASHRGRPAALRGRPLQAARSGDRPDRAQDPALRGRAHQIDHVLRRGWAAPLWAGVATLPPPRPRPSGERPEAPREISSPASAGSGQIDQGRERGDQRRRRRRPAQKSLRRDLLGAARRHGQMQQEGPGADADA